MVGFGWGCGLVGLFRLCWVASPASWFVGLLVGFFLGCFVRLGWMGSLDFYGFCKLAKLALLGFECAVWDGVGLLYESYGTAFQIDYRGPLVRQVPHLLPSRATCQQS